jgi:hypothetical protein
MKHRNHNSYIKMLDWIDSKNLCIMRSVKSIIIDFETADYKALSERYINSTVYEFTFHIGQIFWRRTQVLKFSREISSTYLSKLQVKTILVPSFVPCEKVMEYAIKSETCLVNEVKSKILDLYK